jgi:hypothetical protein
MTAPARVLVLGGYGAFGGRVAERLARVPGSELIIAGRSREKAAAFAHRLAQRTGACAIPAAIDGGGMTAGDLGQWEPAVLINASGPFQEQDYAVARACITARVHYLDLADAGAYVAGIAALDGDAKRAGVLAASGASTVPAVSGAVVDRFVPEFARLETVETVISPGNSFTPGHATTKSILGSLGRPIFSGDGRTVHGWQGLRRRRLPGLGMRWTSRCDAPDQHLFPRRYPGLSAAGVAAALEVGTFHIGLWGLSWLVRAGAVRNPQRLATPLLAVKQRLGFLGSDRGGMVVRLEGRDRSGAPRRLQWHCVAGSGHGPFIPATPSVMLARRLLGGALQARGAMPCLGLLTLDELLAEWADLDIAAGTT